MRLDSRNQCSWKLSNDCNEELFDIKINVNLYQPETFLAIHRKSPTVAPKETQEKSYNSILLSCKKEP